MKRSLRRVGAASLLMAVWCIGRMQGQQDQKVIFVAADKASFHEMNPGVSMAPIWGDPEQGAHATFTKFKAGYDAGTHTHTNHAYPYK